MAFLAAVPVGVSIAATVASTAVGVATAVMSAMSQSQQAQYQAAVAKQNQQYANQNAQDAIQRGQIEAQQQRVKNAQYLAATRSALAGQGADLSSGSALDLQGDTAAAGELDAQRIINNSQREARNYLIQRGDFQAQASQANSAASNAWLSGGIGVASSLLGGASSIASKWALANPSTGNPAGTLSGGGVRGF